MSATSGPRPAIPPARRMVAAIVLVPLLVALALWAFAWPAARIAPRDLPIGIAGPAATAAPLQQQFEQEEGAFDIHRYDDEASARAAIEDRDVYGAVVVTQQGPKLLTASAASPMVAQLLREAVTAAQAPAGTQVQATDVVAAPSGDPRGSALGASILPLALAGVAAGAMVTVLGLRGGRAVAALTGAAVLVGLVAAAITDTWLAIITGNWWTEAGVLGLTVLAMASAVAGLAALIGKAGLGLGGLLMVLIGNSFAGATSAPQLLPEPAGLIGQWLPPGAGGSLLRSTAFFDGSAAGAPALTLSLWAVLGLSAVAFAGLRGRRSAASGTAASGTAATGTADVRDLTPVG